jgi:hypothetical protein
MKYSCHVSKQTVSVLLPSPYVYLLKLHNFRIKQSFKITKSVKFRALSIKLSLSSTVAIRGVESGKGVLVMVEFKLKKSHESALLVI